MTSSLSDLSDRSAVDQPQVRQAAKPKPRAQRICRWLVLLSALGLVCAYPPAGAEEFPLASQVRVDGDRVWVEVSFTVPATRAQVWAVLTDFEHMTGFISNLEISKVVSHDGPVLRVYQKGNTHRGLFDFPFEVLREVHLMPLHRIESHLISGSMKRQEGVTELREEGGATRVDYHSDSIPGVWIPPIAGRSFIESQIRGQFQEIEAEILRRRGPSHAGQPTE